MSAPRLRPMSVADLDRVIAVEAQAYAFPWSRGNLIDSLAAGYLAQLLESASGELLGYFVAMPGVDELHLLNLTVAPPHQGRGHGSTLLEAVQALARARGDSLLWLEVRASNQRAQQMYRARGFVQHGLRRGYYPAPGSRREDAVVMSLRTGCVLGDGSHEGAAGALHGAR